ncbi:hypothetical protein [Streptomyces sp. NPDC020571]|uniref:hypothetical protein n=1 Tax=Streptomyces sp. NPDC020571 TaxID=3365079 RepID=UPI00378B2401
MTTIDLTAFCLFLPEMTLHTQSGCEPECEGGAAGEVSPSPPNESLGGWLNTQRDQYSDELRFPEVACTPERTQHYDQDAVEAFWNAWRQDVGTAVSGPLDGVPETGGGNHGGGWGRARRDRAVALALAELRQAGGYRRGMAAQPAPRHGAANAADSAP